MASERLTKCNAVYLLIACGAAAATMGVPGLEGKPKQGNGNATRLRKTRLFERRGQHPKFLIVSQCLPVGRKVLRTNLVLSARLGLTRNLNGDLTPEEADGSIQVDE